jgi:hypothetical protein
MVAPFKSPGSGEHPAHLAEALLGVDQVGDARDRMAAVASELVLGDPVLTGQPGVEHAVAHVARHLLRADQHALDFRIVDRREVGARADVDAEPGAREELHRGVLQRPLRDAQLQRHERVYSSTRR